MKVKTLLIPLFLVLIVGVGVWFVLPNYYDFRFKREELKTEEKKLQEASEKTRILESLRNDLNSKTSEQEALIAFLPSDPKEENIVSDLNNIASSVADISVKKLSVVPAIKVANTASAEETAPTGENVSKLAVSNTNVEFSIVGPYDKIKEVVGKLLKIKRFSQVKIVAIKGSSAKDDKGVEIQGNNLQADLSVNFNYLKKVSLPSEIKLDVFSGNFFDTAPIEKIKTSRDLPTPGVRDITEGKRNPFAMN